jgi:hypothetical protein
MAKSKPDGAARNSPIDYEEWVKEAQQIIAKGEEDQWRIAELAHLVETGYGEKKLQTFAKDIGMCPRTLERARSVWRAWAEIPEPAPKSFPFAIATALQSHPNRAKIVKNSPDLTRAQARKLMKAYKTETEAAADPQADQKKPETQTVSTVSKRQGELLVAANKATSAAREISRWLADKREVTDAMEEAFREFVEEATGMLEAWKVRRGLPQGEQPDAPSPEVPLPVKPESVH